MLRGIVDRPIGMLMTVLSLLVVSAVFIRNIPISLLPDVPIPRVTLQVTAAQLDARTLENTVVSQLRQQMIQLNDLRDLRTETRNGAGLLELSLVYGANTDLISIEINEKIDQIMHLLPRDVERPRIIKSSLSAIPVFSLNVYIRDSSRYTMQMLSSYVERSIKKRLEQMEEIAFADVHGSVTPEIIIAPKIEILSALNINEDILAQSIAAANVDIGNIIIKDGAYEYNVQLAGRLTTPDQLKKVVISVHGNNYQLQDLAEVILTEQRKRGSFFHNRHPAITISVRKKASANIFELRKNVAQLVDDLRVSEPDLQFELANDQSALLVASIQSLSSSLLYGLVAAILIMFAFFKSWRLPVLIGLTLPIGLSLTLFSFFLLGISINIISLAGLVLGIGLMIDNAIIIVENITQAIEAGDDEAAINGPNEVIRPLISSAMTTGSVFLPLVLLSGLAGALFYDQALSVCLALINSLLVSYFVLPVLAKLLLSNIEKKEKILKKDGTIHDRIIKLFLRHRLLVLVFIFLFTLVSYWLVLKIDKTAMPTLSRTAFEFQIDWNEAIDIASSENRMRELFNIKPEVCHTSNAYIGELQFLLNENQQNTNEIKWILFSDTPLQISDFNLLEHHIKKQYPLAVWSIKPLDNAVDQLFDQSKYSLVAHVQSMQSQRSLSVDRIDQLWQQLELRGYQPQRPPMASYLSLRILRDKAAVYGIDFNQILTKIRTILRSNVASKLRDTDRFIDITIASENMDSDIMDKLEQATVSNKEQESYPLHEFVQVEKLTDFKYIHAIRSGEAVHLNFVKGDEKTIEDIQSLIRPYTDMAVSFSGTFFENKKMIDELYLIVLVVMALLYLILAAQFESFVQPLIVAVVLPIGMGGALLTLYACGQSLNVISMVGLIILLGIDVNDSILKIDMINRFRAKGYPKDEAILLGSDKRLRAIAMTSLTTILAVVPILWSTGLGAEIQLPMALALIGGLTIGTLVSIFFIPVLYQLFVR